jgi:hypothetical protein
LLFKPVFQDSSDDLKINFRRSRSLLRVDIVDLIAIEISFDDDRQSRGSMASSFLPLSPPSLPLKISTPTNATIA